MKEIVRYILETVVCSGILYGAYLLFLRNRTGYLAARLCLTGSLLAAALIPLLRIPVWPGKVIYATAGTPAETTFTAPSVSAAAFDYEAAIWIVYGCGVLLLLSSMFRQALLIRRLRRHSNTGTNRTYRIGTPYRSNRIVLLLPHDLYQPLRRRKRHCGDLRPRKESRHPPPFARTDRYGEPESPAVVESFRVARSTRTYRSGRVRSRPRRTRRGARHRKLSENHLHAAVRLQSGRSRQSVQFINQFINKKTNPNDDNAYEEQIRSAPPDRNAPHRHRPAGSFRIHLQSGRNPHPGQIAVSLHPDRPASGNRQKPPPRKTKTTTYCW